MGNAEYMGNKKKGRRMSIKVIPQTKFISRLFVNSLGTAHNWNGRCVSSLNTSTFSPSISNSLFRLSIPKMDKKIDQKPAKMDPKLAEFVRETTGLSAKETTGSGLSPYKINKSNKEGIVEFFYKTK